MKPFITFLGLMIFIVGITSILYSKDGTIYISTLMTGVAVILLSFDRKCVNVLEGEQ